MLKQCNFLHSSLSTSIYNIYINASINIINIKDANEGINTSLSGGRGPRLIHTLR